MIADLKTYPEYKESGLPWLGQVPVHWEVAPPKRVLRSSSGGTAPIKNTASNEWRPGYVPAFSASGRDVWLPSPMFRGSGLVLSAVGARCGKTFKASGEWGVVANTHVFLVSEPHSRDYWWYVTNAENWWERAGAAQPFVQVSRSLDRKWVLPPPDEQAAIVRFLDWATGRLERAIRAKKKIIALLNEQKQAIIHRAVTRGLPAEASAQAGRDPSVPLKPSGIPWLGDIPRHWGVVRNMALFAHRVEAGRAGLPVLQVSLRSGITVEELDQFGRPKKLIADPAKCKLVYKGDVAYNTMRMWQGAVGVSPCEGLVSPAYVVLKPRGDTSPDYYDFIFHTAVYKQQVNRQSTGIVSDRNRLYWDSFKQMPNVSLPRCEQEEIVAFILSETTTLNTASSRLEREIELLREYRTRLVADVVTGKLDVREALSACNAQAGAARLPDESEMGEQESLDEDEAMLEEPKEGEGADSLPIDEEDGS